MVENASSKNRNKNVTNSSDNFYLYIYFFETKQRLFGQQTLHLRMILESAIVFGPNHHYL